MRLYDRSVDLQLKLEAAQSADTSLELLARGARLVDVLGHTADYFEGVSRFRDAARIPERPVIDMKVISQAVSAFRAGISRHGSAAFQHQPAMTLAEAAKAQRERAARWLSARWRDLFAEYDPLIERATTEHLVGSKSHQLVARARAAQLRALRNLDPVANVTELDESLGTAGDVSAWIAEIRAIGTELRDTLAALDAERATLSAEVRAALQRSASADGLPLEELTDELLAELREAGVQMHLVVRRR